ncbi:unnamed protein product, partial [Aphanomyces euteiches]
AKNLSWSSRRAAIGGSYPGSLRSVAQAQYSTRTAGAKVSQIQAAVESFLI